MGQLGGVQLPDERVSMVAVVRLLWWELDLVCTLTVLRCLRLLQLCNMYLGTFVLNSSTGCTYTAVCKYLLFQFIWFVFLFIFCVSLFWLCTWWRPNKLQTTEFLSFDSGKMVYIYIAITIAGKLSDIVEWVLWRLRDMVLAQEGLPTIVQQQKLTSRHGPVSAGW